MKKGPNPKKLTLLIVIIESCPTAFLWANLFITWAKGEVLLENNLSATPDLFYAGSPG
jgi:hypothetical protein